MNQHRQLSLPPGIAKIAMQVFLGLLVVNACVAIAAVLGATGDSGWQVIGTTLLLTAGCLVVAANAAAIERGRLKQLPYAGVLLSCIPIALLIIGMWMESLFDYDTLVDGTVVSLTIGVAMTYASLLATPSLTGPFATARLVGYGAVALLAVLICGGFILEDTGPVQTYAVLCIVLATATVIVLTGAVVQARSSSSVSPTTTPIGAAPIGSVPSTATSPAVASNKAATGMVCPGCATSVAPYVGSGSYGCGACGLGFTLQITSPPTHQTKVGV